LDVVLGDSFHPSEVKIGFRYDYDTISNDIETRRRLCLDGKRIKVHDKGSDAYQREFHTNPVLTLWIDRIDWKCYFDNPVGTPIVRTFTRLVKNNQR
jgi:CRISPR-associated protein Cas5t